MPDISKITLSDGTTYNIKDSVARRAPIETHTYTNVIGTANDSRYATFFYAKLRGTTYNNRWRVVLRVTATVPGTASNADMYNTVSEIELWGMQNTYGGYYVRNYIQNTSYRPFYYHSLFVASSTGYNNNCGDWLGVNMVSSASPANTSYKRQFVIDLLEYENCEIEFSDTLYTPDTIPERAAHTGWYSSTVTSWANFDAASQGTKMTGDADTTTISTLARGSGNFTVDSVVYRYQMVFHTDENTLTPLNNVSNGYGSTSKAMLTEVEFDPFMPIYYYDTTTTIQDGGSISAGSLKWHVRADMRYSFNCGTTLVSQKPFYLVVTPTTYGKCKLASSTPWAQELPSTADGKWYIYLGRTYSNYQIMLYEDHPIYEHNGTGIVRVLPIPAITNAEIDAIVGS